MHDLHFITCWNFDAVYMGKMSPKPKKETLTVSQSLVMTRTVGIIQKIETTIPTTAKIRNKNKIKQNTNLRQMSVC